jgi:hypothetical protein
MFVRVKTVAQDGRRYEYLQIVRTVRDGGRVRQELVASLGRRDWLVATGKLDQLLHALARFSTRLRVVEAARDERFVAREARSWGPALVFGRLWERQGLPEILGHLAAGRRFGFDPERVAFALALQRLCAPGSDLQGAAWAATVEAPGFDDLALHQFYRTLPWLAAVRHRLEQDLFFQNRDLFSAELDLVFVDTTSTSAVTAPAISSARLQPRSPPGPAAAGAVRRGRRPRLAGGVRRVAGRHCRHRGPQPRLEVDGHDFSEIVRLVAESHCSSYPAELADTGRRQR